MIWLIILPLLLLALSAILFWHYWLFSRTNYLNQSRFALLEVRHETRVRLFDLIKDDKHAKEEIEELMKMIGVLDFSVKEIEALTKKSLDYTVLSVFPRIDASIKKAEQELQTPDEKVVIFKSKFSQALLPAFNAKFILRFKSVLFIKMSICRLLGKTRLRNTFGSVENLKNLISVYKQVELNARAVMQTPEIAF